MQLDTPVMLLTSQPTYDSVQVPLAAVRQTVTFFAQEKGRPLAGAVNKTYSDTNILQGGRLDKGKNLLIQALSMHIRHTATGGAVPTRADYETVYNRSFIDVIFGGDTSFLRVPAIHIPAGNGQIEYRSNITPAATEFSMWHGASHASNLYQLPEQMPLLEQESIEVNLTIEGAIVAPVEIMFFLWGTQSRPIR